MRLIQSTRMYFRNLFLQKDLQKRGAKPRKRVNIKNARSIGLLFDATELNHRQSVLKYAEALRKNRKKVSMLGFFNGTLDSSFSFNHFSKKQIDWAFRPKGKEVDYFLQQNFDIFVFLSPITTLYSEYIAALTYAHLKVGPYTQHHYCYDLMIMPHDEGDLKGFMKQLDDILKKTNFEHEAAKI